MQSITITTEGCFFFSLNFHGAVICAQHQFQKYFSYVTTVSFIGRGNNLPKVIDKLYHTTVRITYTLLRTKIDLTTLMVIGTKCIGRCKTN